jgi:hypothetical protein
MIDDAGVALRHNVWTKKHAHLRAGTAKFVPSGEANGTNHNSIIVLHQAGDERFTEITFACAN